MCISINFAKFRKSIDDFLETHHGCCSAKMGTFIFAMINCILMALGSIVGIFWFIGHVFWYFILGYTHSSSLVTDLLMAGISAGTMVIAITSFLFGVLLLRGILMNRPMFIRTYFIFGVMVVTICIATAITLSTSARGFDVYVTCALIIIVVCGIYSAILGMIWVTYRKYQKERPQLQFYNQNLTVPFD